MSDFKDILSSDLTNVFINEGEFAALHTVNGARIPVMLDSDRLLERRDKAGLSGESLYFYVCAVDLPTRPLVDSSMMFDGVQYVVTECLENEGLLEVALMRQNSGMR